MTTKRLSKALGCIALAALTAAGLPAPPAAAVDPATAAKAAYTAYTAYKAYTARQLSVQEATDRILLAIDSAETAILAHLDRLAAADGRACATSALANAVDLPVMTLTASQTFANSTVECLTLIQARMRVVSTVGAFDDLGFALNVVGPVALLAKARAGMATEPARALLDQANENILLRIQAQCSTTVVPPPVKGAPSMWQLRCVAYNGSGIMVVYAGAPVDYTVPRRQALSQTSQPVAVQALAVL